MKKYSPFFSGWTAHDTGGFSTILALLLTGFLVTLTAGILFLFLSENRINQSLFSGTAAYHASEGALEYALLKIKNHREGFSDSLWLKQSEWAVLENSTARDAKIGYEIIATGTAYSGTLTPDSFEIIPLFYEAGKTLKTEDGKPWKDPRNPMNEIPPKSFDSRISTPNFTLNIMSGDRAVWNVIGNEDLVGTTFGISWILYRTAPSTVTPWVQSQVGNIDISSMGTFRKYNGGILTETTKNIGAFLGTYVENYLVLYNPSAVPMEYTISASTPFTLPKTQIVASGKLGDSIINLQMTEDKSRLYDILKYSLFVPN